MRLLNLNLVLEYKIYLKRIEDSIYCICDKYEYDYAKVIARVRFGLSYYLLQLFRLSELKKALSFFDK